MQELEQLFRTTFEDRRFTSSERKQILAEIEDAQPDGHKLAVLRSKIFDMAREAQISENYPQVLEWLEWANKLLLPKVNKGFEQQAYFSPGEDCLNAILSRIQHSIHSLDICVFTISDDRIRDEILFSHQKGARVRIISDNDKRFDKGSDIETLSAAGIEVRIDHTDKHMHNKFAIFDDRQVLTGSYNWTRSAARSNEENIVISDDPGLVRSFQREFDQLWRKMHEV